MHREREREHETEAKISLIATGSWPRSPRSRRDSSAKLAQARLEKGVEASSGMVNRGPARNGPTGRSSNASGAKCLEEAILFFKQLGSEGSNDPIVRRLAARAYLQCGNVQMTLGSMPGPRVGRMALTLYQGLVDQFPKDFAPRWPGRARILLGGLA